MIKVGILFGGPSREREIAFAGGRTVYDNLNKSLFEPIPIFIDSHCNFILLDWQYVYKGTIRDFYPPVSSLPDSPNEFQIYLESLGDLSSAELHQIINKVGRKIELSELADLIDVAFLSLHGSFGEDGQIQGLLESLQIPYTGSGIRACSIGMDKAFQKKIMEMAGFACPEVIVVPRSYWLNVEITELYQKALNQIGFPMVIRPANQGSSIGVAIIDSKNGVERFTDAMNNAFFRTVLSLDNWRKKEHTQKVQYLQELTDIRDGLGFPVNVHVDKEVPKTIYHPEELLVFINTIATESKLSTLILEGHLTEQTVIIESFIHGKEFSCVVIRQEDGTVTALPPTEIIKGSEVFDYRSKYLPGLSRKVTPIYLEDEKINEIRQECERLFEYLEFNTYARIDGFMDKVGEIYLNDPNTTSGMLPSSFFFHQAAEIGLNPSQFLTYIIRASLQERIQTTLTFTHYDRLLTQLDQMIESEKKTASIKKKIAVILGGYSSERHISVESGRNVFEKLASSDKYEPIPVFLTGDETAHEIYQIPINLLLKDNADDIQDNILKFKQHDVIEQIKEECRALTNKYASDKVVFEPRKLSYSDLKNEVDGVFIALHGRPGEDGEIQRKLDDLGIPYNGSPPHSSQITIDKYRTLQTLKQHGFEVTNQLLLQKETDQPSEQFYTDSIQEIETNFDYPFIAKPVDDGCSSAVKLVKNQAQLDAFLKAIFRERMNVSEDLQEILGLKPKEEFPQKQYVLIEQLITAKGAKHFLEITGGLLTKQIDDQIEYELFEPSEALATGEVLSLEEKFLAGEGQNITPARFADNATDYKTIAEQVKADLKRAAQILNVQGYARIDAFVRVFDDNRAETIIIEVNSLPGMTPATCIFHQAAINGYKPYRFIDQILEFGFGRKVREGDLV